MLVAPAGDSEPPRLPGRVRGPRRVTTAAVVTRTAAVRVTYNPQAARLGGGRRAPMLSHGPTGRLSLTPRPLGPAITVTVGSDS